MVGCVYDPPYDKNPDAGHTWSDYVFDKKGVIARVKGSPISKALTCMKTVQTKMCTKMVILSKRLKLLAILLNEQFVHV